MNNFIVLWQDGTDGEPAASGQVSEHSFEGLSPKGALIPDDTPETADESVSEEALSSGPDNQHVDYNANLLGDEPVGSSGDTNAGESIVRTDLTDNPATDRLDDAFMPTSQEDVATEEKLTSRKVDSAVNFSDTDIEALSPDLNSSSNLAADTEQAMLKSDSHVLNLTEPESDGPWYSLQDLKGLSSHDAEYAQPDNRESSEEASETDSSADLDTYNSAASSGGKQILRSLTPLFCLYRPFQFDCVWLYDSSNWLLPLPPSFLFPASSSAGPQQFCHSC